MGVYHEPGRIRHCLCNRRRRRLVCCPGHGPGAAGSIRRCPRAGCPWHPGEHVHRPARTREGFRRLWLGRCRLQRGVAEVLRERSPQVTTVIWVASVTFVALSVRTLPFDWPGMADMSAGFQLLSAHVQIVWVFALIGVA